MKNIEKYSPNTPSNLEWYAYDDEKMELPFDSDETIFAAILSEWASCCKIWTTPPFDLKLMDEWQIVQILIICHILPCLMIFDLGLHFLYRPVCPNTKDYLKRYD